MTYRRVGARILVGTLALLVLSSLTAPATASARMSLNRVPVNQGEMPFLVSIHSSAGSAHRCSGTLVDQHWVLTADHCVVDHGATYTVRVGSVQYYGGTTHAIASIEHNESVDLALLRLAQPVALSAAVGIVLLDEQPSAVGRAVRQAGWGATDPNNVANSLPNDARRVDATIQFCGGGTSADKCAVAPSASTCGGDSGGPIIDRQTKVLVGTIRGSNCVLGAETRLAFTNDNLDWLRAAIGCNGHRATLVAQVGVVTHATNGVDVIVGTNGTDYIYGYGGDDHICGGMGTDRIYGGVGNDYINGGGGSEWIWGESGNDTVDGGSGADHIYGGAGHDRLNGMGGQDTIHGESGNDTILGNHQSDKLYGGPGNDRLYGHGGKDKLWGGDGDDLLYGGVNTDELDGGAGIDLADGQRGRDSICVAETVIRC